MAKFVFNDGKVFSGGYDLSDNVTNVNLELTAEELDATTLQSGGFTEKLGGLKALDGSITATGNSTGANLGAVGATEKCYVAIHCTSVSGTSTPTITFKLQSDDNSSFTSPTDRITFTGITAIGADFQSVAGAITDTHWRLNYTVSGTNPNFSIHATVGIE